MLVRVFTWQSVGCVLGCHQQRLLMLWWKTTSQCHWERHHHCWLGEGGCWRQRKVLAETHCWEGSSGSRCLPAQTARVALKLQTVSQEVCTGIGINLFSNNYDHFLSCCSKCVPFTINKFASVCRDIVKIMSPKNYSLVLVLAVPLL